MDNYVWVASALTGGLAGSFCTFVLQQTTEKRRVRKLSNSINMNAERVPDGRRLRVLNGGSSSIVGAQAYITLKYDKDIDVLTPQGQRAFIAAGHLTELNDDRLCWALADPDCPNPYRVDIYPGEAQGLDVARVRAEWVEVASERGFSTAGPVNVSRVFLKRQVYEGIISIVGMNILRRTFKIKIDPDHDTIDVEKC